MSIYKREKVSEAIESFKRYQQTRGSRRNLLVKRCNNCLLMFETFKQYPKQWCVLCRYEASDKDKYTQACVARDPEFTVEHHYINAIGKGIALEKAKRRQLRTSSCVVTNMPFCPRLKEFISHLDPQDQEAANIYLINNAKNETS